MMDLLQGLKETRHGQCSAHSKYSINICYYMLVGFLGGDLKNKIILTYTYTLQNTNRIFNEWKCTP